LPAGFPNGFCLLNNIAIAVEAAFAEGLSQRVAVLDWDVHHGNGTEAIFYDRGRRADDLDPPGAELSAGFRRFRGSRVGRGRRVQPQYPAPPGAGHVTYVEAMERLVLPSLQAFQPDAIVVACGFDASGTDPLSRMMAGSDTFQALTEMTMQAAGDIAMAA
jgi:acetoin utilization deacetylase AcuC-like enzyme